METTETSVTEPIPQPQQLVLDFEAQAFLRETAKWARFLAIMGFIFCGLLLILAIFIGSFFSIMGRISPIYNNMPQTAGGVLSVVYILIDVLYFFFPYYLMQFADKMKKGLMYSDSKLVSDAAGKLKSFFKLWGIVTIVAFAFYALILVIALLVGIGGAAMNH